MEIDNTLHSLESAKTRFIMFDTETEKSIPQPTSQPFINNPTKDMITLDQQVFAKFYAKQEDKVLSLAEKLSMIKESIEDLGSEIDKALNEITEAYNELENGIKYGDKKRLVAAINKASQLVFASDLADTVSEAVEDAQKTVAKQVAKKAKRTTKKPNKKDK